MRKCAYVAAVLGLVLSLSACGGQRTNSKATVSGLSGSSVSEILADAGTDSQTDFDTAYAFEDEPEEEFNAADFAHDGIDVDLTRMSSTMVYGQVSGMMYSPEDYVGKTVRMRGQAYSTYYDATDTTYYSIIIADATACCAQGVEYVLADGARYPKDETQATVTGVFELYDEMGATYCRLSDATLTR